jgi:hypothetical protein
LWSSWCHWKRSWSVDVRNGLALVIWTSAAQVMGKRKGWESNWQFDSWPLKVGNRPAPNVRLGSVTWRWKAFEKGYKFGSDLVSIGGRGEKLWCPKVLGVPGKSAIRMQVWRRGTENTIGRMVVTPPESGPWWVLCVKVPVACPNTQGCSRMWTNPFVVGLWMQIQAW